MVTLQGRAAGPGPVSVPPVRTVHHADALHWLREQPSFEGCSFITSLPDISELSGMDLPRWKRWFMDAAALVLASTPDEGVSIFFQSDIKRDGAWVDKGYLVARAAEDLPETRLLWHRVVCRKPPGTLSQGRATYSHLLAFSRGVKVELAKPMPDVLPDAGEANWTRGMGLNACRLACAYIRDNTASKTIVDPFCGRGMVLAAANACGFDAVGVELSVKRARLAQALALPGG